MLFEFFDHGLAEVVELGLVLTELLDALSGVVGGVLCGGVAEGAGLFVEGLLGSAEEFEFGEVGDEWLGFAHAAAVTAGGFRAGLPWVVGVFGLECVGHGAEKRGGLLLIE